MKENDIKNLFYHSNLILIIDNKGKVMYYNDFDDNLNMLKKENVLGKSIFELYPFFNRDDFTVFKAIDKKEPVLNEYQIFTVNGREQKCLNSAFPLINDKGVIGGIVISTELSVNKNKSKKKKTSAKYTFDDIITENIHFKEELETLRKVSFNDSNVLIIGETGTGKELIAHAIHSSSRRKNGPFLIQNCAAIPSSLMESILFGTVKGSFTGAIDKAGLFESAAGGTVLLDEINSMPLDLQSKILRAIESKSIRRVGENIERDIDVRIIASTNEDLKKKVEKGEFRADLYYRLNVISFTIPPLRDRREDIKVLTEYYINHYNSLLNKNVTGISEDAMEVLHNYDWPGNVRELKNAVEFAMNFCENGKLMKKHFPKSILLYNSSDVEHKGGDLSLKAMVESYEKDLIMEAYIKCSHNILRTARVLNIPRQTLYYKLKKYKIDY